MSALSSIDAADARTDAEAFAQNGFIGPRRLLTPAQCELIINHYRFGNAATPFNWEKGRAVNDRFLYDVATAPALLALLRPLIGEDILLWAASIIERGPGDVHPWHVDIESSAPDRCSASIWIGIENLTRESALAVMTRSHSFGATIQQVQYDHGRRRGEASSETVLAWAREFDRAAQIFQPDMSNGDAIIYDGRLWHSTNNTGPSRRTALLLQYVGADHPMRLPDFGTAEWPFHFTEQRLPALVVSGEADESVNWLVPPPVLCGSPAIPTLVQPLRLPLNAGANVPFQSFPFFDGPTSSLERMECHASVLGPGHSPHPPHVHDEEEILICLDGEAELVIADLLEREPPRLEHLKAGDFVYYPAYQRHTIRNCGSGPVTYLMFKWQSPPTVTAEPLATDIWHGAGDGANIGATKAFRSSLLFEQPTLYLDKLHAHTSELQPGGGYDAHVDDYDVAIVMLKGKVETVGRIVEPFGVVYYPAGEPHGMRNVGNEPARYLIFEFHAPQRDAATVKLNTAMNIPALSLASEPTALPDAEPAITADLPARSQQMPHPLRAINAWFWSDRRPRTHIVEYSLRLYRGLRSRLGQ